MRTRLFAMLALLLCLAGMAGAQTLGEISGEVRDPSGAVIGGAKVVLTNVATNAVREVVTNDAGIYSFPAIPPGMYTMRVEREGFRGVTRSNIEIQVQQSARIDFELTVGSVAESIEVSAQAALLSSENATVGTVIENKRIVELPLNGRNYLQLVSLAPNVSFGFPSAGQAGSRQGGIRADQSISIAGQRSQFNHYTLDGVENTDPNFNTFVVLPSIDALQEFKVQTGIYPAEFGRQASQINVSTRSGGNDFHGALFYFLRNDKLDAKNYAFTAARPPKDPFKWNQFGFMLSGPVLIPKLFNGKNRLFFMSNYEWFRQRRQVQSVSSLASSLMRQGNFSELLSTTALRRDPVIIRDPATRQPFPGNIIPSNRFHRTSVRLLEFYPEPNLPNLDFRNNFVQAQGRPVNRDQFIQRLDFVESSKSSWFARYSWGDENQLTELLRLNGNKIISNFNQYMASNTRVITPSMVNEFRFGFTQFYNTTGPELAFTRNVVSELSIPGLDPGPSVQWGIPSIGYQGVYSGFGNDSEGPYENNNSSLQFLDNFSWIRGKHAFKFGGEVRRDVYNQVGNQFARGNFVFTGNATTDPFADFLLGQTFQAEAAVSIANARFRALSYAFFVDDVWKIRSNVTINWGLRYEYTPPWEDQTGTLFNGIVRQDVRATRVADRSMYPFFMRQGPPSNDPYAGIRLRWPDIEVRQDGTLGDRLVGVDRNDFAPRLGITWNPSSKWVVRAGAGYFYSQDAGNPRFDMARNLAGRTRFNSSTTAPDLTWDNAFQSLSGALAQVPRPYTFANPYDRRTPYTMQYLFNIQRELPGSMVLEIGYLGSQSRHLEALRAVNETIPACPDRREDRPCRNDELAGLSLADRSPFPNFGRIQLVDNGGVGNYNALGVKATKRYSGGITFLLGYTWSKSLDTATAIRNQGGDTLFPQNSYCRACEYGRSAHDARQRFTSSFLWDVPFGKGRSVNIENSVLNALAGGWQIGSIVTLQTGFPITVTNGLDTSNTGAFFDRPDATGQDPDLPRGQQDPARFFNTRAFVLNQPGRHGNVGRNTLTGPGIIAWDFSTLKDFRITESHKVQFRFEAFNFPNHPLWGNPNTNVASSGFGQITGTRTNMRNLQFGLKYLF